MSRNRFISLFLAFLLVFTAISFLAVPAGAELNFSGLNRAQQYYVRLIGSHARADYYETDVLASVTLTQAVYEGGYGAYSLPVGGNNIFGIKAYSSWGGKVYSLATNTLYNSYSDFLVGLGLLRSNEVSAWRAHDSWGESVRVHSTLFTESSKYAAVIGEKDYKKALQAIVDGGYCNDDGYVEQSIKILERYGFDYYDDLTPDEDGIVALTADTERVFLTYGQTHSLSITYYPADKTPSQITYASDRPDIATVDEAGNITAVSHGMALITATLANGREACCIVYVDCNATIIDETVNVRETPTADATSLGKIYRGWTVKVASQTVYVDEQGNEYTYIKGCNSKGEIVKGYVLSEYVYKNKRNVSEITLVKDEITLTPKQKYTALATVAPIDAKNTTLTWTSSDTSVATVDAKGVITAKAKGNAIITAKASGGVTATLSVTVADATKEYNAIIVATDSLRVRSVASWSAGSLGSINFLSQVTVKGEPKGFWYEINGITNRDKDVTGFVFSTYIQLVPEDKTVSYLESAPAVSVYEQADDASKKLGMLADGGKIAIVGEEAEGWSYVIGKSATGNAIYGYVKLDGSGDKVDDNLPGEIVSGWYGRVMVSDTLNVRETPSTSGTLVGELPAGQQIVIYGEENGWYKVMGTDVNGNKIIGYASSDYIAVLYDAEVIGIDDNLNVRSQPSTSSDIVGKLQNGNKLTVIGELEGDWYSIETDSLKGYCSSNYIQINGKIFTEIEIPSEGNPDADEGFAITDSALSIENRVLTGVSHKTTVKELLEKFTGEVSVYSASDKKLDDSDLVATGCQIRVTQNGKTETVARVCIVGDVNGNGKLDSMDYIYIKRAFFGTYDLKDTYLQAALVSGEEELTVMDYVLVKRAYYGTYKFK